MDHSTLALSALLCAFLSSVAPLPDPATRGQALSEGSIGERAEGIVAAFLNARTVEGRRDARAEVLAANPDFDEVFEELRRGRAYAVDAPRGRLLREHDIRGLRHPYTILVPEDYTTEKRYPVRFDLHGGMGADEWKALDGAWNPGWTHATDQIVILPAGWWDSMWWEASQVENFESILREVRRTWNVDENRVVMTGSSDGGAGLFFSAMRNPDRWAGYLGFVAPPDRLVRAEFRPDGQMHISNLRDQRFLLGYGSKDKLVPLRYIEQYMKLFQDAGADIEWYALPGQGHSLQLPDERFQQFVELVFGLVRDPLPEDLSWATEEPGRYGRRSWLVIDQLGGGPVAGEGEILPRLGTRLQLRGPTMEHLPWGRVVLHREGNTVRAETTNVAGFRLLISPDEFDLDQPIRVLVNGELGFEGRVEPDLETLLAWASLDDDRTQLFAAEVTISVPPSTR